MLFVLYKYVSKGDAFLQRNKGYVRKIFQFFFKKYFEY